jgi:hypothetical protein
MVISASSTDEEKDTQWTNTVSDITLDRQDLQMYQGKSGKESSEKNMTLLWPLFQNAEKHMQACQRAK